METYQPEKEKKSPKVILPEILGSSLKSAMGGNNPRCGITALFEDVLDKFEHDLSLRKGDLHYTDGTLVQRPADAMREVEATFSWETDKNHTESSSVRFSSENPEEEEVVKQQYKNPPLSREAVVELTKILENLRSQVEPVTIFDSRGSYDAYILEDESGNKYTLSNRGSSVRLEKFEDKIKEIQKIIDESTDSIERLEAI
ncbi:MAG: hypothetical protein Q7R85_03950 [bacterium]|nr:hypothetical protein [bacterium]